MKKLETEFKEGNLPWDGSKKEWDWELKGKW